MSIESLAAIAVGDVALKAAKHIYKQWNKRTESDEVVAEAIGSLAKEAQAKRDAYLTQDHDPTAAIEKRRLNLIQRLTVCQNRILFEVSDTDLVARLVLLTLEQTTAVYGASREAEFGQVEMAIGQIESILARNRANLALRAAHRTLAVWVVGLIVIALVGVIAASSTLGVSTDSIIPLIQVPLPVVIWSGIGSLGAMLYRFNNSADAELADPLRWSFTRPLTGILMGIITYMAFKLGALILQPVSTTPPGVKGLPIPDQLLWLAAFLAGFSDRFADSILRALAGRLGGDNRADLISLEAPATRTGATLTAVADRLGGWAKQASARLEKPTSSKSTQALKRPDAPQPRNRPPQKKPPRTAPSVEARQQEQEQGASVVPLRDASN